MAKKTGVTSKKDEFELSKHANFTTSYTVHNKSQTTVIITLSDLKLKLIEYRKNVVGNQVLLPLTSVVAFWVPFFTSDFKGIAGIEADIIKGCYFMLGVIISVFIFKSLVTYAYSNIFLKFFPNARIKLGLTVLEYKRSTEPDPVKYAEYLCEEFDD